MRMGTTLRFWVLFGVIVFGYINVVSADSARIAELSSEENADKLVTLAQEGDPDACYLVGVMAIKGGITDQARFYLEKGAANGSPDCMAALGQAWEQGVFGEVDPEKALFSYKKAAEKNHGVAMLKLGNMYREGAGIPKDYKLAGHWTQKAAKAGIRIACMNLGLHYLMGYGTKKDLVKAFALYHIAGVESEEAKLQAFAIYEKLSEEERIQSELVMMEWEKIYPPAEDRKEP